jgi:hypothetical protein
LATVPSLALVEMLAALAVLGKRSVDLANRAIGRALVKTPKPPGGFNLREVLFFITLSKAQSY